MKKTRLGISVGLMGFIMYIAIGFGGYIPMILLAGYILLFESNEWLKKSAIKAAVLLVAFSLINGALDLIPSVISFVNSIFVVFNSYFTLSVVTNIIGVIESAVSLMKAVLFIIFAVKSLTQGTVDIKPLDKFINKHSDNNEV